MKIAVIGNYPPRKCGIATYTENFVNALLNTNSSNSSSRIKIDVFAMTDRKKGYDYPKIVKKSVRQNHLEDYYDVVEIINSGVFTPKKISGFSKSINEIPPSALLCH